MKLLGSSSGPAHGPLLSASSEGHPGSPLGCIASLAAFFHHRYRVSPAPHYAVSAPAFSNTLACLSQVGHSPPPTVQTPDSSLLCSSLHNAGCISAEARVAQGGRAKAAIRDSVLLGSFWAGNPPVLVSPGSGRNAALQITGQSRSTARLCLQRRMVALLM